MSAYNTTSTKIDLAFTLDRFEHIAELAQLAYNDALTAYVHHEDRDTRNAYERASYLCRAVKDAQRSIHDHGVRCARVQAA